MAQEVRVLATGAHPGKSPGRRELFAETASTVLVFEHGGVIHLAAEVVPGQLLFLTNQETRREVVAQVTHKRGHRPKSCYVEVKFTEPSPNFWGIEFQKTPARAPGDAKQAETAELMQSKGSTANDPCAPTPVPDPQDVERLKQEVKALREQLRSLRESRGGTARTPAPIAQANAAPSVPGSLSGPPTVVLPPSVVASSEPASTSWRTGAPQAVLPESSVAVSERTLSEGDFLPEPALDFDQVAATATQARRTVRAVNSAHRSGTLRIGILSAALVFVATGAARYLHGIPWLPKLESIRPNMPFGFWRNANSVSPKIPASPKTLETHADPSNAAQIHEIPTVQPVAVSQAPLKADTTPGGILKTTAVAQVSVLKNTKSPPSIKGKLAVAASSPGQTLPGSSGKTTSVPVSSASEEFGLVPPKLIRSVRAVAPPEALRDFVTGNVTLDATVDAAGYVKTAAVLSGPASLRNAALDAAKQYRYLPAMQDGRPVAAHLKVTIQFWFEP